MTMEFNTLVYVGRKKNEQPSGLSFCAFTASFTTQEECDTSIPKRFSRYSGKVNGIEYARRTDVHYDVSSRFNSICPNHSAFSNGSPVKSLFSRKCTIVIRIHRQLFREHNCRNVYC